MRFQERVNRWIVACFGQEIADDPTERSHRFLEEALELAQACHCSKEEVLQLVDYVYNREIGEIEQEVGGVMNTLAALCTAYEINMLDEGHIEIDRCWTKLEKIRAKQKAKPKFSPLPQ